MIDSRDRDVVFAGADAGENAGPGQDLLLDLERRGFAQIFDQLVVEAGRLAVLDEFEGAEIVLGRNDQAALLDFVHACGLGSAEQRGMASKAAAKPSVRRLDTELGG